MLYKKKFTRCKIFFGIYTFCDIDSLIKIDYIVYDKIKYFKAIDVAKLFGYENYEMAVHDHVDLMDQFSLSELLRPEHLNPSNIGRSCTTTIYVTSDVVSHLPFCDGVDKNKINSITDFCKGMMEVILKN